ncbi:MAG: LysM peptidoglycan-binding domain-containing protein, partial [bacterium]
LPNSRSEVGAVGMWQLMPATARDYGLKINRWIDERRDPEKSTVVAAEFLQFLFSKLGNWDLVLAAYNCGYPKLRRIMRREQTSNYWELRHLPRETYNFVPKFYAVLHIFAAPENHGIVLPERVEPVSYETIDIEATFSLDQIARLANVSPAVIKAFNPALTADIAPSGKYSIRVPLGVKEHFMKQFENNPPDQVEITYTTYRVRRGDTLAKIAKKFRTTVHAIQADNNLRSSRWINTGMKLQIATVDVVKDTMSEDSIREIEEDRSDSSDRLRFSYRVERQGLSLGVLARYYRVSRDEIIRWNPDIDGKTLRKGQRLTILKPKENVTYHRIRRGDSLWRLARRNATSVSSLRRWNQIRGSRIYPGDMLIVVLK